MKNEVIEMRKTNRVNVSSYLGVIAITIGLIVGVVNSSWAENGQLQTEASAWEVTVKNGSVDAYLAFARKFPKSERIQVRKGTVRGRFWYKVTDGSVNGVLVTVAGTKLLRNVTLTEAKAQAVIGARPPNKGEEITARGRTFNWTCLEITSGGLVFSNNEAILPKDSEGATVVISGDGTTLLAWYLDDAKTVATTDKKPTYINAEANKTWLPEP